jgi:hypothetical protein
MSGKCTPTWRKAIRFELAALHSKGTFRMKNVPLGRNAISNKWVFKVKAKPDGSVDRLRHDWLLKASVNEKESTTRRRSLQSSSSAPYVL